MTQFVSQEIFQRLEKELQTLKSKRKEVAERLKKSAAFGDLSENSEYQQAREEKEILEKRIFELEQKLRSVEIKEKSNSTAKVSLYSKVKVKSKGKIFYITLVSPEEIDLSKKKISERSPLGRRFLRKKKNDVVKVKTPLGKETYEILKIE